MRSFKTFLIGAVFLGLLVSPGEAGTARILKTLPHHLDQQGRHTVAPSLYERDAYQAHLRKEPKLCSGLRFDVQWKAIQVDKNDLKLRVEVRSSKTPLDKPFMIEQAVQPKGWFTTWTGVTIDGDAFRNLGKIIAWRVTLWEGGRQLAEQRSFLWQDSPGGVTETKR
ncbi:MAG: hypothetical protein HYZ36_08630 [Pedosphaera parvula]|nr:hypothetical protein [Pedosphaera parvula]